MVSNTQVEIIVRNYKKMLLKIEGYQDLMNTARVKNKWSHDLPWSSDLLLSSQTVLRH